MKTLQVTIIPVHIYFPFVLARLSFIVLEYRIYPLRRKFTSNLSKNMQDNHRENEPNGQK